MGAEGRNGTLAQTDRGRIGRVAMDRPTGETEAAASRLNFGHSFQRSPSTYVRYWVSPSLQFRGLAIGIGSSDDDTVGHRSNNDSLLGESVEEQPPGS